VAVGRRTHQMRNGRGEGSVHWVDTDRVNVLSVSPLSDGGWRARA
jgi:hypothetical protein